MRKRSYADEIMQVIARHRFETIQSEAALEQALSNVFERQPWAAKVRRQHRFSRRDIVDFLVGGTAAEIKTKARSSDVFAQLARYAAHPEVVDLVLIATSRKLLSSVPAHVMVEEKEEPGGVAIEKKIFRAHAEIGFV